ncbi:MAG: ADP-ribosylglycohydrolase family protein, partial [Planctomycetota bacterium]
IWEFPRTLSWMELLAKALAASIVQGEKIPPLSLPLWQIPFRNLLFTLIVLSHGFRRLLPPY